MKIISRAVFLLSLVSAVFWQTLSNAQAQSLTTQTAANESIAMVNGKAIPLLSFAQAMQNQLRMGAQDSQALREAVRRDLVVQAVLVDLAEKSNLDNNPEVAARLEGARGAVLAQAWQKQWLDANPPMEVELQAEYERLKSRAGDKEYQIRQVVLRDETDAELVMNQLKEGRSLAEMARQYSIETLGKEDGGLLPWVTADALVSPLGEAIVNAKVGQMLPEPVRTASGFHIVQLVADRPFAMPPLEQLRNQLLQSIAQQKLRAAVQEQVSAAKIVLK